MIEKFHTQVPYDKMFFRNHPEITEPEVQDITASSFMVEWYLEIEFDKQGISKINCVVENISGFYLLRMTKNLEVQRSFTTLSGDFRIEADADTGSIQHGLHISAVSIDFRTKNVEVFFT